MNSTHFDSLRNEFFLANRNPDQHDEAALCFAFTIYYDGSVLDNSIGILHFYETALPLIHDYVTCFDVDARMRFKKIQRNSFDFLKKSLATADPKSDHFGLILESGRRVSDVSDRAFHFYHSGTLYPGFIRLVLPLEVCAASPAEMVALGLDLTSKLKVLTGYGGFCLATYLYGAWEEKRPLYVLSRRFRGVDFADPYRFREYQRFGLNAANWLTWLGERWLPQLGGKSALIGAARKPVIAHEMSSGILLQAGPEPVWGEANNPKSLDEYRAAGRLIRNARFPVEKLGKDGPIGGSENTREWLQRFDT